VIPLERVSKWKICMHLVTIATTLLEAADIPSVDEVSDDALSGPLGDAHEFGDIAGSQIGVSGETDQNMTMVGEEGPARLLRFSGHHRLLPSRELCI
jgi:hypothetical protein